MHKLAVGGNFQLDSDLNIPSALIRQLWEVFAAAFVAEARELKIPHFKFSLPRLISFQVSRLKGSNKCEF